MINVNEQSISFFNEKLYNIFNNDNLIINSDGNIVKIDSNKISTIKNLIDVSRINTLNSITENYLTNSKTDTNSIYLLRLTINNVNLIKLK